MSERQFLTTVPGTQMLWSYKRRKRPCLRCRLIPWGRHWRCRPGVSIRLPVIDLGPRDE